MSSSFYLEISYVSERHSLFFFQLKRSALVPPEKVNGDSLRREIALSVSKVLIVS